MITPIKARVLDQYAEQGDFLKTATAFLKDSYGSENNRKADPFWKLWKRAQVRVSFYPASTQFHGVWIGGLNDHINDILAYMWAMSQSYQVDLEPVEIAVLALVHDWEKLWKYKLVPKMRGDGTGTLDAQTWGLSNLPGNFTVSHLMRIGAFLNWAGIKSASPDFLNALTMSEGGWSLEAKAGRFTESSPAAALLHAADMFSAKVLRIRPSKWALKLRSEILYLGDAEDEVNKKSPIEEVLWPS